MKKLNKKAFTLIEILATVAILGILSVVAMVSVNKIIQNAKEKHYTNAEDQLELAGQSYVQQYRSALPKAVGQKTKIPLKKLVDTNYIEQIKDYSDNDCDLNNSYVQIFKYSQDDYSYLAYLDCPVYNSNKNSYEDRMPSLEGTKITGDDMDDDEQWLHIEARDTNKLISYSYTIYRYDKEVKNSGSIPLPNYDTEITKDVSLKDYTPGKIKVIVTATNIYGNTATFTTEPTEFADKTPPTCLIDEADLPTNPKAWTTETRKITVGCDDKNGSGCTREKYTKTFKASSATNIITIEDNAGNTTDCEVSVNIDITKPSIKVTAYKRSSSGGKGDKIKTVTSNHKNPDKTLDLSEENTTKWLNNTTNPDGIYYEVVYSDGQSTVTYTTKENPAGLLSTAANVNTMSVIESSTTTGKSVTRNYETTLDGHRIYTLDISDEIGNTNSLKIIAPLDRESPTQISVSNPSNEQWVTADFALTLQSKDTLSGIESFQYTFKKNATNITSNESTGYVEYADSSSTQNEDKTFTTPNYTTEGDNVSYLRACDVAGNCSTISSTKIKLDKTKPAKPTLDISGTSTLTVKMTSSDDHSGIAYFDRRVANSGTEFTKYSETGKTSITITTAEVLEIRAVDNAGNVSDPVVTKHCNTSGGTLTYHTTLKDYVCVIDSWLDTKTETISGCYTNDPMGCSGCGNTTACKENAGPWTWWCSTGWAGAQCYQSNGKSCTTEVEYYTCGSYDEYSGSGSSLKCYVDAQTT